MMRSCSDRDTTSSVRRKLSRRSPDANVPSAVTISRPRASVLRVSTGPSSARSRTRIGEYFGAMAHAPRSMSSSSMLFGRPATASVCAMARIFNGRADARPRRVVTGDADTRVDATRVRTPRVRASHPGRARRALDMAASSRRVFRRVL